MKRTVSIILMMVFTISFVTANAAVPKFLTEDYNNYTGVYHVSLAFESSDDIIALLEELDMPKEVENFVDLKMLLKSLLSYDTQMLLQADISDDFKRIEIGLTSEMLYNLDINSNLNINADMKMGMWVKLNIDDENPVFEIIYSHPMLNKYMVMDVFGMIEDKAEKEEAIEALTGIFNKEYIESIKKTTISLMEKYADIKVSGSVCTIKLGNDELVGMLDELMLVISEMIEEASGSANPAYGDEAIVEMPSFAGLKLLGDGGLVYKYSLLSGKISKIEASMDLDIDISNLVTALTGEEWEYEARGRLTFEIKSDVKVTDIGRTKVKYPVITNENSFNIMEMMPEPYEPEYDMQEERYPNFYAEGYVDYLPVIDGELYVPVRQTFTSAYEDQVEIGYSNGVIKLNSSYFPGFTQLKMVVGSDMIYLDSEEYKTDKVIERQGVSYVSHSLLEEVFGWELSSAYYDMINKTYDYYFYTMP